MEYYSACILCNKLMISAPLATCEACTEQSREEDVERILQNMVDEVLESHPELDRVRRFEQWM